MNEPPLALFERLKVFLDFTDSDVRNLVELKPVIAKHGPTITARFYERLGQTTDTARLVEGRVGALQKTHLAWLNSLVGGTYDEAYLASRWRIGLAHVRVGLDPHWVEGVMSFIRSAGIDAITAELAGTPTAGAHTASFVKACDLDMLTINLSYAEDRLDRLTTFTGMKRGLIENIIRIPKK
ncbi:Methyl-accepting chemotaxis protein [Labilithrix luteola]|uniref:Methyl-accepting chemotaxis protein n=1 Tax=Labilithrix luteola TaxID=1391654 RepID=A0A0K1Q532_9BACT|nr:protoglobin domain-containing protein [Labilithrix luteola]AKV00824.1 Methyl-accepting chemotaxis protein [Labilithrix luteola]